MENNGKEFNSKIKKDSQDKNNFVPEGLSFKNEVYKKLFLVLLGFSTVCYLFLNQKGLSKIFITLLSIAFPFILGGALAFIIKIVLNFFEEKIFDKIKNKKFQKYKRPISIFISLIAIFLIIFLILRIVIPQFVDSMVKLQNLLPELLQRAIDKSRQIPYLSDYSDKMQETYNSLSWSNVFKQVRDFAKSEGN